METHVVYHPLPEDEPTRSQTSMLHARVDEAFRTKLELFAQANNITVSAAVKLAVNSLLAHDDESRRTTDPEGIASTPQRRSNMLNTRIDPVTRQRLEDYANKHGVNVAKVVRLALDGLLNNAWQLDVTPGMLENLSQANARDTIAQLFHFLEGQRASLKVQLALNETQLQQLSKVLSGEQALQDD